MAALAIRIDEGEHSMSTPDPKPDDDPGHDAPPLGEPDEGTTEAEEDEGEPAARGGIWIPKTSS